MENKDPKILVATEDVLSTLHQDGKRRWVYAEPMKGRWQRMRLAVGWALIALFVALPIIPIGGKPSVLLDFIHREFTFFGTTLYPTDTVLLMLFGIGSLLAIALTTALFGRAWCGWGCPQTVYMEFVFRPLERLIEGKPSKARRRDAGPPTADWVVRRGIKIVVFAVISVLMSHIFLSYFVGWAALTSWMTEAPTAHWGFFVGMAFVSLLIFVDFYWFREQMCTIACPYARIQSVLVDRNSSIVSYDPGRGEPRGRKKKGSEADDLGDCVDCGACVRTCPTNIDIRDGLQMECIACTQCIDACDPVMEKLGLPKGLIRYTSENELDNKPIKILRPRIFLYSVPILVIATVFVILLFGRGDSVEVNIGRVAGAPFVDMGDGTISNRLRFRLRNRTSDAANFTVEVSEPAGTVVRVVGEQSIALEPGEQKRVETWVVVPAKAFTAGSVTGRFRVVGDKGDVTDESDFMLLGPSPGGGS